MLETDGKSMQILFRLTGAGARKKELKDFHVDWKAVLNLASEQNILPLIGCTLLHSPKLDCPDDLRQRLLEIMRMESSTNMIRMQRIMCLLSEMKDAGIDAKVLKGYAIAVQYGHPECRGSVDTDLLIDIKQEKQAVKFLEERGFQVMPRAATSPHVVCQHKKYGKIELHIALYAELIREVWFQNMEVSELIQEDWVDVETSIGKFTTLGYTDQLIFLTLHMVKHFILGGMSLRMMLDIALYFAENMEEIDAERYWTLMDKLRYGKLVNCILWAMILYGGFEEHDFRGLSSVKLNHVEMLLSDLEQGGYLGVKEKEERLESGMEYNHQLIKKQKNTFQYKMYMLKWKIKTGLVYMFPSKKTLSLMYPSTTKFVVLLPVLWIWQVISFPIKKIFSGVLKREIRSNKSTINDISGKRVELFKTLDMI